MTSAELDELETWAKAHAEANSLMARLTLLAIDELRKSKKLNLAQAERITQQSELLSKRAEGAK